VCVRMCVGCQGKKWDGGGPQIVDYIRLDRRPGGGQRLKLVSGCFSPWPLGHVPYGPGVATGRRRKGGGGCVREGGKQMADWPALRRVRRNNSRGEEDPVLPTHA